MKRGDERSELVLFDVLDLVDEQRDTRAVRTGCRTDSLEELLHVGFEVAVVGEARLGLEVETYLDVVVLDLQRAREAGESPERAICQVPCGVPVREPQQRES